MPSSTSSSKPVADRRLRAWLRDLAAFLAVLALGLGGLEALVRARFAPTDAQKFGEVAAGLTPAVVVLGSSTALRGVDPRLLVTPGRTAYNAAMQGGGPRYWRAWYELIARPRFRPSRVLIDLPWFWEQHVLWRRLEHDADLLPADAFAGLLIRSGVDRATALLNRAALIKYRKDFLPIALGRYAAPSERYESGWVPQERPFDPQGEVPARPRDEQALSELEALLDDLAADGVAVVLFQSPSYLPAVPAPAAANAPLDTLARRRGLPFLNYNAERRGPLNEDRGAFLDPVHLAKDGATRFSARLAVDLAAATR